jgi:hypothetical protein
MTLSLRQAFAAKESGAISWDDYIHILLARCTGVKHEEDDVDGTYPALRRTDPLGHELWFLSKRMDPIKDTSALEAVFQAYRHSTLDDVKNKLALLEGTPSIAIETVKKSLALLACQDRRPDALKYFLDQGGFPIEATLEDEADSVDPEKDPETYKVLQESRQLKPVARAQDGVWQDAATTFDKGGRLPVNW